MVRSIYLYREVNNCVGQLPSHHNRKGVLPQTKLSASATACRVRLSVVYASYRRSGHGHTHLITLLLTPLLSFSTPLLFSSILFFSSLSFYFDIDRFYHNGHINAFSTNLLEFSFTLDVILTDTSVPPLQFSSWGQSLDMHHSFQGSHGVNGYYGQLIRVAHVQVV